MKTLRAKSLLREVEQVTFKPKPPKFGALLIGPVKYTIHYFIDRNEKIADDLVVYWSLSLHDSQNT